MTTKKIIDTRIAKKVKLPTPQQLRNDYPISQKAAMTVFESRQIIAGIIQQKDSRIMVISGPCSIHDTEAALDFARRMAELPDRHREIFFPVMRVYFDKPRSTIGWKGITNDPFFKENGECDMEAGLVIARKLMIEILEMGVPIAAEFVEPILVKYFADLLCWCAIGARTSSSQPHREEASGISAPCGIKNDEYGHITPAIQGLIAAGYQHTFPTAGDDGDYYAYTSTGNDAACIVLRGGLDAPNYDCHSVARAQRMLVEVGQRTSIIIDCSHDQVREDNEKGGRSKNYINQLNVWKNVIYQRLQGNEGIIGLMVEANINAGQQKVGDDISKLEYGVSITDPCISWKDFNSLLEWACVEYVRINKLRIAV